MSKEDIARRISALVEPSGGREALAKKWGVHEKRMKQILKGRGIVLADIQKMERMEREKSK